jgi:hypothetical protein
MDTSQFRKGIVGQFYDSSDRTCLSFYAEENIPIGVPLMRGTNQETQCKIFNGGITTEMIGVAGYSSLQVTGSYSVSRPQSYYPKYEPVTVVHAGKVWIPLYGTPTVEVGDTAYIDTLNDRITNIFVDLTQSIPIGRFLTGGTATSNNVVFALDIIPGFSEEIPAIAVDDEIVEEVSKTKSLKVNLKKRDK